MKHNCDFSGYATKNDIVCSDGRTIKQNAFADQDGCRVPLVWNHDHINMENVIGHADLENRGDGVYAYCSLNDSEYGQLAKKLIMHGDITSLSIFANKLTQMGSNVVHGIIRELSLVHAGANDGATIDYVMAHGDEDGEGFIYSSNLALTLYHSDDMSESSEENDGSKDEPVKKGDNSESSKKDSKEETVEDVINSMTDKQREVMYSMIDYLAGDSESEDPKESDDKKDNKDKGENEMKHNVFDDHEQTEETTISHSAIMNAAIKDAKRYGSMKDSFIEHAAANGITNVDMLFPDAEELNNPPVFIKKDESWVADIMGAVKHTPFSRVKTTFATLDETEARARGYIKGKMKKEIALALLKRVTTPTTVYIKMKIDRDDVIDISSFDVIEWQKREMRSGLDKELARAMLLGDGRSVSSEDKINEQNIRPVLSDDDMYTIKYTVKEGVDYKIKGSSYSDNDSEYKGIIRAAVKSRKEYKGSGKPTFYTTEDVLTNLLLLEDQNGRQIYESEEKLATALRVKKIVTIPEMENYEGIYGIIVNMNDYTAGADKGGAVGMFDDFDIDYNQMKYLMETRMSGALTVPYSAIVLKKASSSAPSGSVTEEQH